MTAAVVTAVHCPACGRRITEAEEIKVQRLRCKSCRAYLTIDLDSRAGSMLVQALFS